MVKRGLLTLSALVTVAAPVLVNISPASAAQPGNDVEVALGGSDTTELVMGAIAPIHDGSTVTVNGGSHTVHVYNILANGNTPNVQAGDGECSADVNWTKDPLAPSSNTNVTTGERGVSPFGSTAGRNYLATEHAGTGPVQYTGTGDPSNAANQTTPTAGTDFGCIDVARSSGAPSGPSGSYVGDSTSFEYYAFALDAVSWASTSMKSPSILTTQNLKDVYNNCTVTDWSQLPGGASGSITRYYPQAGSGTRSFFQSTFLTGTPANSGACASVAPLQLVEENNAKAVAFADIDKAIFPYSGAVWTNQVAQVLNPSLDKHNGSKFGSIQTNPTSGSPVKASAVFWNGTDIAYELDTTASGVVKDSNVVQFNPTGTEANGLFPGVRYVYNVLDSQGNRKGYQAAKALFGFNNVSGGTLSPLCDARAGGTGGSEFAQILSFGFGALPNNVGIGAGGSNQAGGTCRFFQGV